MMEHQEKVRRWEDNVKEINILTRKHEGQCFIVNCHDLGVVALKTVRPPEVSGVHEHLYCRYCATHLVKTGLYVEVK